MNARIVGLSILLGFAATPANVPGLGFETFGNKPIKDPYGEWPGLLSVINDPHRVYHYWVNGGQGFYFEGDTEALNQALERFARVEANTLEVAILPGPARETSLQRQREFKYDWSLRVNSGIAAYRARGEGGLVWNKDPMLTVYVGGGGAIALQNLRIPPGISVLQLKDLRERHVKAIRESNDVHVRGWGAGSLARLDHFSNESLGAISGLLQDTNDWVRLNAVGALTAFGKKAVYYLPALRQMAEIPHEYLQKAAKSAAESIGAANEDPADELQWNDLVQKIAIFQEWAEWER